MLRVNTLEEWIMYIDGKMRNMEYLINEVFETNNLSTAIAVELYNFNYNALTTITCNGWPSRSDYFEILNSIQPHPLVAKLNKITPVFNKIAEEIYEWYFIISWSLFLKTCEVLLNVAETVAKESETIAYEDRLNYYVRKWNEYNRRCQFLNTGFVYANTLMSRAYKKTFEISGVQVYNVHDIGNDIWQDVFSKIESPLITQMQEYIRTTLETEKLNNLLSKQTI